MFSSIKNFYRNLCLKFYTWQARRAIAKTDEILKKLHRDATPFDPGQMDG